MKARLLLFITLWIGVAAVIFWIPGCYGHNCDQQHETYGIEAGEGHMVTEDLWESNGPNEPWLPYPRQQYYFFNVAAWGGRTPTLTTPYLSASPQQGPGANYVIGSGNIAEMFFPGPNSLNINNDTCSDYYLRMVVQLPPFPPEAGVTTTTSAITDAGTD